MSRFVRHVEQFKEPAILPWRPFPPLNFPEAKSHLGGLPKLPKDIEWPRSKKGVLLHFLASIDCAELPENSLFPKSGTMLFFARISEEMIWQGKDQYHFSRVLYVDEDVKAFEASPDNVPPIVDGWHQPDEEFRLPNEPLSTVYPKWTLQFFEIYSWPVEIKKPSWHKISEQNKYFWQDYRDCKNWLSVAEIMKVTRCPVNPTTVRDWGKYHYEKSGHKTLILPNYESGFPHSWLMVEQMCRVIFNEADKKIKDQVRRKETKKKWRKNVSTFEWYHNEFKAWRRKRKEPYHGDRKSKFYIRKHLEAAKYRSLKFIQKKLKA